ncbi:hypothetical protein F511_35261 [Dorcoceras hygrometricum]|uniref:Uncharacterized protein n=1 Tax=Dorcoceras hygrometricum TaxID=472368 RepID=A0A2Z7CQH1_9LAMI|nr:hypothetical protein F511_35261 [Dorcoceras hygrometricum]
MVVQRRPHACGTCAPLCATFAHGCGHLRAQLVQVGRQVCGPPCATCVHGYWPACAPPCAKCAHGYWSACATRAHQRAQRVRTVTGQRAQHVRNGRRDVRTIRAKALIPLLAQRRIRIPLPERSGRFKILEPGNENSTKISRTESPRRNGRNKISVGGGVDSGRRRRRRHGDERRGRKNYMLRSIWYAQSAHCFQVHHCGSIIIPIDDQIGSIYTVYKTEHYAEEHLELRNQYLCDPQWFRDTAIHGLTTFVTPKPHFRTNPSDQDSIGYPRTRESGESSTTKHRLHMLRDLTRSRHLMTLMESMLGTVQRSDQMSPQAQPSDFRVHK